MKGLKKLALATAVAAAPFTQAMESLDDSMLADMTGQAGITIDVNLDMHIDAIKYVDQDGNGNGQGAITLKGIHAGSYDPTAAPGDQWSAAQLHGITIDADATDGLVIGLNKIGGYDSVNSVNHGIDIKVDAVLINNGMANLTAFNALDPVNQSLNSSMVLSTNHLAGGSAAIGAALNTAAQVDMNATADKAALDTAAASAGITGVTDADSLVAVALNPASPDQAAAQGVISSQAGGGNAAAIAAGTVLGDAQTIATNQAGLTAALGAAGQGNIGGFIIEDFRNYIENSLVEEYNARFDMALQDSAGDVAGVAGSTAAGGRYVRGEIVINGTGNYLQGSSGLRISGEFGGAIDRAAWVDDGGEFGVKDLGFFHGADNNLDGISDIIEGMHISVDIDVVDNHTSSVIGENMAGTGIAVDDTVSALKISKMTMTGTVMMGDIYVGDATTGTSLGSVLIKDIDMSGTEVFIYGH